MKYLKTVIIFFLFFILPNIVLSQNRGFTNKMDMEFVYIPAGTFMMGSPPDEMGRNNDENLHQVTITAGFYILTTEVTQGQWKHLMGNNPSENKKKGSDGPVEQVSWHDCKKFIDRLNIKERTDKYRLPTEAEWEYVSRAGSTQAFEKGEIKKIGCILIPELDSVSWYCGNSGFVSHKVALKMPNVWGVYDMNGNLKEWCVDSCSQGSMWTRSTDINTGNYNKAVVDPISTTGDYKIVRGGCWNQNSKYARSADRSCFMPIVKRTYIGFRVVKEL